jgi:Asp-tRNA(Asn)/Glu-tRNA(Gln) amidotransferase A subunit family amidase
MAPVEFATIAQTSRELRARRISPVELLNQSLRRIEELNASLNACITVARDQALAQARQAENEIQSGRWRGPLHGIPIGLKDLIDMRGIPTTAASAVFHDRVPREDAQVVKRLKAAGAILVGKHNLHEFAYGASSLVSYFGPVRSPIDPEFIAGGSSGGSVAAVGAGMCLAAIGTDTAGSIRQPAALCGLVGLKPSYGRVSTRGIVPLSSSLDHAGPITRTVEDAALVLDAIADPPPSPGYAEALAAERESWHGGIPRKVFFEDLDDEVRGAVEAAIQALAELGCELFEIDLAVPTDRTVQSFEAYAWHRERILGSPQLYQKETLSRLRSGERITPAEYEKERGELVRLRKAISRVFAGLDLLVMPATPRPAPRIADLLNDPERLRPTELLLLRNTRPMNVWGLPAISVPCGRTRGGLPIGIQLAAPPEGERTLLRAAYAYEEITNFA